MVFLLSNNVLSRRNIICKNNSFDALKPLADPVSSTQFALHLIKNNVENPIEEGDDLIDKIWARTEEIQELIDEGDDLIEEGDDLIEEGYDLIEEGNDSTEEIWELIGEGYDPTQKMWESGYGHAFAFKIKIQSFKDEKFEYYTPRAVAVLSMFLDKLVRAFSETIWATENFNAIYQLNSDSTATGIVSFGWGMESNRIQHAIQTAVFSTSKDHRIGVTYACIGIDKANFDTTVKEFLSDHWVNNTCKKGPYSFCLNLAKSL